MKRTPGLMRRRMLLARDSYGVASTIWCDATYRNARMTSTAWMGGGGKHYSLNAHHMKHLITHYIGRSKKDNKKEMTAPGFDPGLSGLCAQWNSTFPYRQSIIWSTNASGERLIWCSVYNMVRRNLSKCLHDLHRRAGLRLGAGRADPQGP